MTHIKLPVAVVPIASAVENNTIPVNDFEYIESNPIKNGSTSNIMDSNGVKLFECKNEIAYQIAALLNNNIKMEDLLIENKDLFHRLETQRVMYGLPKK